MDQILAVKLAIGGFILLTVVSGFISMKLEEKKER